MILPVWASRLINAADVVLACHDIKAVGSLLAEASTALPPNWPDPRTPFVRAELDEAVAFLIRLGCLSPSDVPPVPPAKTGDKA